MAHKMSEEDIRGRNDYFVTTGGGRHLHVLHPDSTPDNPEPKCGYPYGEADPDWTAKPVEVFPLGFRRICEVCRVESSDK